MFGFILLKKAMTNSCYMAGKTVNRLLAHYKQLRNLSKIKSLTNLANDRHQVQLLFSTITKRISKPSFQNEAVD